MAPPQSAPPILTNRKRKASAGALSEALKASVLRFNEISTSRRSASASATSANSEVNIDLTGTDEDEPMPETEPKLASGAEPFSDLKTSKSPIITPTRSPALSKISKVGVLASTVLESSESTVNLSLLSSAAVKLADSEFPILYDTIKHSDNKIQPDRKMFPIFAPGHRHRNKTICRRQRHRPWAYRYTVSTVTPTFIQQSLDPFLQVDGALSSSSSSSSVSESIDLDNASPPPRRSKPSPDQTSESSSFLRGGISDKNSSDSMHKANDMELLSPSPELLPSPDILLSTGFQLSAGVPLSPDILPSTDFQPTTDFQLSTDVPLSTGVPMPTEIPKPGRDYAPLPKSDLHKRSFSHISNKISPSSATPIPVPALLSRPVISKTYKKEWRNWSITITNIPNNAATTAAKKSATISTGPSISQSSQFPPKGDEYTSGDATSSAKMEQNPAQKQANMPVYPPAKKARATTHTTDWRGSDDRSNMDEDNDMGNVEARKEDPEQNCAYRSGDPLPFKRPPRYTTPPHNGRHGRPIWKELEKIPEYKLSRMGAMSIHEAIDIWHYRYRNHPRGIERWAYKFLNKRAEPRVTKNPFQNKPFEPRAKSQVEEDASHNKFFQARAETAICQEEHRNRNPKPQADSRFGEEDYHRRSESQVEGEHYRKKPSKPQAAYRDQSLSAKAALSLDEQNERIHREFAAAVEIEEQRHEDLYQERNAKRRVVDPRPSGSAPVPGNKAKPSLLNPTVRIVYIAVGHETFAIYRDFLDYYCPTLVELGHGTARYKPVTPRVLSDISVEVFGLFVKWLYTENFLNDKGDEASPYRLMQLWVMANRLSMPQLGKDCLEGIVAERSGTGQACQMEDLWRTLRWVYNNTSKSSALIRYLVEIWGMDMFQLHEAVGRLFPTEMLREGMEYQKRVKAGYDGDVE